MEEKDLTSRAYATFVCQLPYEKTKKANGLALLIKDPHFIHSHCVQKQPLASPPTLLWQYLNQWRNEKFSFIWETYQQRNKPQSFKLLTQTN